MFVRLVEFAALPQAPYFDSRERHDALVTTGGAATFADPTSSAEAAKIATAWWATAARTATPRTTTAEESATIAAARATSATAVPSASTFLHPPKFLHHFEVAAHRTAHPLFW